MKTHNFSYRTQWWALLRGAGIGLLMALAMLPVSLQADDTDIYLKPPINGDPPIVMLMLAYRPNLGSTVCAKFINGDAGAACKTKVGDSVWPNLVSLVCDSTANRTAAGATVCSYNAGTGLVTGVAPNDNVIDTDDTFRAVLMTLMADKELYGVKIGLMMSHNQQSGKDTAITQRTVNSDGAMIMQGAIELQQTDIAYDWTDPSNNARDILIKKIKEIPAPAGATSHPFAPKENFYEYYQYLTAGNVFFADNGYFDFGDANKNPATTAPETNFVSPNNPSCATTPCATTTVTGYNAARYNLDAWGGVVVRNRDGNFWPTNIMGASGMTPDIYPSFANTWDAAICTGGSAPASNKNIAKSCLSCRNGETNCQKASYVDPFDGAECSKVFAITSYVANNFDTSADDPIKSVIGTSLSSGDAGVKQWLGWLYSNDINSKYDGVQNVTTYLIADGNKFGEATAIAQLTGTADTVLSLDENPDALLAKLKEIFKNILVKSAAFTAPSIPVNTFDRSDINNVAYLAMFQSSEQPFWPGNVKKYGINEQGKIVDANGVEAYETFTDTNGKVVTQIKSSALSEWTSPDDMPNPPVEDGAGPKTDGRAVRLGGAGQLIPGNKYNGVAINPIGSLGDNKGRDNGGAGVTRMLFTDNGSNLIPLNATDANANFGTLLATTTSDMAPGGTVTRYNEELIAWARGNNVAVDGLTDDWNGLTGNLSSGTDYWDTPRTWMLGDVLHSRPVAIDYSGVAGSVKSRLFFGSNDGFLHQVTDEDTLALKERGGEVWAYMPREVMPTLQQWSKDATLPQHPYGVDGAIAVRIKDDLTNDTNRIGAMDDPDDKAYLYFGLRRGGNAYYGLEVTDPDAEPKLLWKISDQDSDFKNLGMTFARPLLHKIKPDDDAAEPAVFISAGYNGGYIDAKATPQVRKGKDEYQALGKDDDVGNTVYIVNADTGKLIWNARDHIASGHPDMVDSIASEPSLIDMNGNGIVDRMYVGDTGGRIWRMDTPEGKESEWKTYLLADVGRHDQPNITNDRRFFSPMSVALVRSAESKRVYLALAIVSGDREHPTQGVDKDMTESTVNSFFLVKDFLDDDSSNVVTLDRGDMTDITANADGSGSVDPKDTSWYFNLFADVGEIGTSRPQILLGGIFFTTYTPTSVSKCSLAEGRSFLYTVNFKTGKPLENFNNDGKATSELGEGMAGDAALFTQKAALEDDPSTPDVNESDYSSTYVRIIVNGRTIDISKDAEQEIYWRDIGVDPVK